MMSRVPRSPLWIRCLLAVIWLADAPFEPRAAEVPRLFPEVRRRHSPAQHRAAELQNPGTGASYRVELRSTKGAPIVISSPSPAIRIPPKAWANLLRDNPGQPFYWDISARAASSGWTRFATVTNQIAREEIDGWLAYRLLKPIFTFYTHLGIYQRDLGSFEQRLILEQDSYNDSCLNCHTPLDRNPDTFAFNIRTDGGKNPMILVISNQAARVEKTMGYLAWHPERPVARLLRQQISPTFSIRLAKLRMSMMATPIWAFTCGFQYRDLPARHRRARQERDLAGLVARWALSLLQQRQPPGHGEIHLIRYDLMRVGFDLPTGQWGQPEMMISSSENRA